MSAGFGPSLQAGVRGAADAGQRPGGEVRDELRRVGWEERRLGIWLMNRRCDFGQELCTGYSRGQCELSVCTKVTTKLVNKLRSSHVKLFLGMVYGTALHEALNMQRALVGKRAGVNEGGEVEVDFVKAVALERDAGGREGGIGLGEVAGSVCEEGADGEEDLAACVTERGEIRAVDENEVGARFQSVRDWSELRNGAVFRAACDIVASYAQVLLHDGHRGVAKVRALTYGHGRVEAVEVQRDDHLVGRRSRTFEGGHGGRFDKYVCEGGDWWDRVIFVTESWKFQSTFGGKMKSLVRCVRDTRVSIFGCMKKVTSIIRYVGQDSTV